MPAESHNLPERYHTSPLDPKYAEENMEAEAASIIARRESGDINFTTAKERIETAEQKLLKLNRLVAQIDVMHYQESPIAFFENLKQIEILFSEIEISLDFLEGSIKRDYPHYNRTTRLYFALKELIREPRRSVLQNIITADEQRKVSDEARTKLTEYLEKNREKIEELRWTIIFAEKNKEEASDRIFIRETQELRTLISTLRQDLEIVKDATYEPFHSKWKQHIGTLVPNDHSILSLVSKTDRKHLLSVIQEKLNITLIKLKQTEQQEWAALKGKAAVN